MKKHSISFSFIMLYTIISFAQEMDEPLRIPLHQSKGAEVEELFDRVEYIPLESSKNAMIQEVTDLWVTGEDVIVFDRRGMAILFFNRNGQFLHKIDKVPNCVPCNRAESLFSKVFINKEKKEVYAVYGTTMDNVTMGIFDFEGNFLGEKKEWYKLDGMGFMDNSILMSNYLFDEENLENMQFAHHDSIKTISFFDPRLKDDYSILANRISKTPYNGKLYWADRYENTIYSINTNGNVTQQKLVFPLQYSLPADFVEKNHAKLFDVIQSTYPHAIFGITHIMKGKNFLFLNLISYMPLNDLKSVFIKLDSGEVYDLNQVRPSALNNYVPIASYMRQSYFLDNNGDEFYSLIYPQDLLQQFIEEGDMTDELEQTPSFVQDIVKNRDVYRNPILTVATIKK